MTKLLRNLVIRFMIDHAIAWQEKRGGAQGCHCKICDDARVVLGLEYGVIPHLGMK